MHLCAELIAASMMFEPLGEVGANFSLQLSSRTQFTKINNKKVIAENQCEKHKKSSLTTLNFVCMQQEPHIYFIYVLAAGKFYDLNMDLVSFYNDFKSFLGMNDGLTKFSHISISA